MSETALAVKDETAKIRERFAELCQKTNVEKPRPADVKALAELLSDHSGMELWRRVVCVAQLAETTVIENASAVPALKECWKQRVQALKKELGYDEAPMLERLLIQQAALCWLKLNLVELNYSSVMKQSITLTLGMYWEKRLSAAQKRFTRACESLAKVRRLTRGVPSMQVNIATNGGKQINVATEQ